MDTAGRPIAYTVSENSPEGFELVSLTGDAAQGFVLTNRQLGPMDARTANPIHFNAGDTVE